MIRPLAIVAEPADYRRLFARFAQVRSDFSPLSTWCHVFSPHLFSMMEAPSREANLGEYEAAWAGLAIAEAAALAGRPVGQLKLAACLSTQTFALARSLALWPQLSPAKIFEQFDLLQRNVRPVAVQHERVQSALQPIWLTLASLNGRMDPMGRPYERVARAAMALNLARQRDTNETLALQQIFQDIPQAAFLQQMHTASAEERLRNFDALVEVLSGVKPASERTVDIAFLAGYLATVAAGGSSSLGLASDVAQILPEVSAWAYVIGGLGERVTWTGGFDGLGRLVAREIMRPFWLEDAPTADFSADEAKVLVDRALSDPLVHLQIKQSRAVTVSLYPGGQFANLLY